LQGANGISLEAGERTDESFAAALVKSFVIKKRSCLNAPHRLESFLGGASSATRAARTFHLTLCDYINHFLSDVPERT